MAYLVLDDRGLKSGDSSTSVSASKNDKGMTNGEISVKGKEKDQTGTGGSEAPTKSEVITIDDDEEVKAIDPPSNKPSETTPAAAEPEPTTRPGKRKRERERQQYQTLAVRPAGAVVPMLHNLLNPFVLGVTKSARQVRLSASYLNTQYSDSLDKFGRSAD